MVLNGHLLTCPTWTACAWRSEMNHYKTLWVIDVKTGEGKTIHVQCGSAYSARRLPAEIGRGLMSGKWKI